MLHLNQFLHLCLEFFIAIVITLVLITTEGKFESNTIALLGLIFCLVYIIWLNLEIKHVGSNLAVGSAFHHLKNVVLSKKSWSDIAADDADLILKAKENLRKKEAGNACDLEVIRRNYPTFQDRHEYLPGETMGEHRLKEAAELRELGSLVNTGVTWLIVRSWVFVLVFLGCLVKILLDTLI